MNFTESANKINQAFQESNKFYKNGISSIKRAILSEKQAGDLLIEVKNNLPYGQFGNWIVGYCSFSHRHANRMMMIAKNWEKITASLDTCVESEDIAISLRSALALVATKSRNEEVRPPSIKHKVAIPGHECYGEIVEEISQIGNDIILCKTSKGEFPFLLKELSKDSEPLAQQPEIIDIEIENPADKLREAISIIAEYLPEPELKIILSEALTIGKHFLPETAQGMVSQLISQEVLMVS